MLEVYLLEQFNIINARIRFLTVVCEIIHQSKNTNCGYLGIRIFIFLRYISGFVHSEHTSNMAACYLSDVKDVTAPHE